MITITSLSPFAAAATPVASHGATEAASPRHPPSVAAPSAVFVRSERYQALEHSPSFLPTDVATPASVNLIAGAAERAGQTAANILGFVELQLQRDLQDGDSTEQLSSRVLAGLEGFKQGFTAAAGQLSAMGLLSDELQAELLLTYNQVLTGAQELHRRFVGADLALDTAADNPFVAMTVTSAASGFAPTPLAEAAAGAEDLRSYVKQQLLEQLPGVDALLAYLESLGAEHEHAAYELLERLSGLAGSYTASGADSGYTEARSLGYSDAEIGAFVQQLAQPGVQRAQRAYGELQPPGASPDLSVRLQPLVNFAVELREIQAGAARQSLPEDALLRMTAVAGGTEPGFSRVTAALLSAQRDHS